MWYLVFGSATYQAPLAPFTRVPTAQIYRSTYPPNFLAWRRMPRHTTRLLRINQSTYLPAWLACNPCVRHTQTQMITHDRRKKRTFSWKATEKNDLGQTSLQSTTRGTIVTQGDSGACTACTTTASSRGSSGSRANSACRVSGV